MKKIFTILFLLAMFSLSGILKAQIPTNGLVGYWPFSGNANDASGNSNNGTINGATLITDRFGNANSAYSFNGIDNFISVSNSPSLILNSEYSFSFWIKPIALYSAIATFRGYTDEGFDIFIGNYTPSKIDFNVFTSPSWTNSTPNQEIVSNTWYNLVITYDLTNVKIYINNNLVLTNTIGNCANNDNKNLYIGKHPGGHYFNGIIDDIRIYDRALTTNEITALYNESICYQTITVTDTLIINANLSGFNPVTYANTIKVYPNPTKDHIYIRTDNNSTGYQIKIINTLSQIVYQTTINQTQYYIDLNTWSGNGTYFVQLYDTNGNLLEVRKIVLQ